MSDRSSFGRINGRHAIPMLTNGMSWRMNHVQLKYILKEPGTLNDEVSSDKVAKAMDNNLRLRANVQPG